MRGAPMTFVELIIAASAGVHPHQVRRETTMGPYIRWFIVPSSSKRIGDLVGKVTVTHEDHTFYGERLLAVIRSRAADVGVWLREHGAQLREGTL